VGITGSQRYRLQNDEQQREPHGELGKDVMKRNGEGELQTVEDECVIHRSDCGAVTVPDAQAQYEALTRRTLRGLGYDTQSGGPFRSGGEDPHDQGL
jgi:hypothetical protein